MDSTTTHITATDGKYIKIGTFVGTQLYLAPNATNEAYSLITEEEKDAFETAFLSLNEE